MSNYVFDNLSVLGIVKIWSKWVPDAKKNFQHDSRNVLHILVEIGVFWLATFHCLT